MAKPKDPGTNVNLPLTDAKADLPLIDTTPTRRATESVVSSPPITPRDVPAHTQLLREKDDDDRWQEIFIPVHGLIRLTAREILVVDHPAFQRLGEIYQLGQTHLVYRGATHKRLEHALGTAHVAQLMIDALARTCHNTSVPTPEPTAGRWALDRPLSDEEIAFVRLGALLHDLGHLPAGHTLEDELGLLPPHDADERLNLILDRMEWRGVKCETSLRLLIDGKYKSLAMRGAPSLPASEILLRLVSKDHENDPQPLQTNIRFQVCRDIIGNTICADLLDYLHRDWLHLGKRRELDQRLLEYLEIRTRTQIGGATPQSHLVINLRGGNRIRTDAATSILDLLESRYQLSEIALFHRTKLCAAAMLERMMAELSSTHDDETAFIGSLPEQLLDCSDSEMMGLFLKHIDAKKDVQNQEAKVALEAAHNLAQHLMLRQLYKEFMTAYEYNLADATLKVQNLFAGPDDEPNKARRARIGAINRLHAMRNLEIDFGLPRGSLVMYCPPAKMNTKIAEVRILIHGDIHTLDNFEKDHEDRGITGGHLRAQKQRFRRLWRVLFAIDSVVRAKLEEHDLLQALGRAIDLCVLQKNPPTGSREQAVASLARELVTKAGTPLQGRQVEGVPRLAARGAETVFYPGGAPSLLSCAVPRNGQ